MSANKKEFLNRLDWGIRTLPYDERCEILADYEDHFARGREQGKDESEICEGLGDPAAIANEYVTQNRKRRAEQDKQEKQDRQDRQSSPVYTGYGGSQPQSGMPDWAKVMLAIALVFLNVCIVAPVWFALVSVILVLAVVFLALVVAGIAVIAMSFVQFICFFAGLALIALGLLGLIGAVQLARYFVIGTIAYGKMNMKLVREGKI